MRADLTDRVFGNLTVMHCVGQKAEASGDLTWWWLCACACGTAKAIRTGSLTAGYTKSCGACSFSNRRRKPIDLTNQRFGRLTAVEATDLRMAKSIVWWVHCDCGNWALKDCHRLRSKLVKSCGCLVSSAARLRESLQTKGAA